MSKTYFFIFSVGPVQSFIAQVRKAQDLFLGCRMVSDYCRHAAFAFKRESKGGEIIFPKVESDSITNRFMGRVEIEGEEHAKRIGEAVEKAARDRFVAEGMKAISTGLGGFDVRNITGMEEQLANHLETYWAFSLYDEKQGYAENYRRAERVFGMGKYMRTPKQLKYQGEMKSPEHPVDPGKEYTYHMFGDKFLGETGRKCVVDGERNVKIYRWSVGDRKRYKTVLELLRHKLFLKSRKEVVLIEEYTESKTASNSGLNIFPNVIQDGEGLSAVSFFKRCYVPDTNRTSSEGWEVKYSGKNSTTPFPSTVLLAIQDCIQNIEDKEALKQLETSLKGVSEDEFFLEENLNTKNFIKHGINIEDEKGKKIIDKQKKFEDALKNQGATLHSYFALIAIDIDNLGKHLKKLKSRDEHEKLAQKLHDFAGKVENISIIERELGRSLHAGGDDFLLALNLYGLFAALQEIEEALRQTNEKYENANLPLLTYSTAIVITHYKAPLTRAVKTVKAELKAVKERFEAEGKNGVACSFMLKSGAVTTSYFKQDKLKLLKNLFGHLQAGRLSPKFIFQFAKNMAEMGFHGDTTPEEQEDLRKFALWELQRLIVRARNEVKMEKENAVKLAKILEPLLAEQVLEGGAQLDLDNFLQFLKMAELAAKHTNKWNADT